MAKQLKFGNGEWYGADGSILAYNDLNDNYKPLPFKFERGSSATRVNKEGLIELVGSNQPRVDYKDSSDGVFLLEKEATNLVNYSSDLSVLSKVSVGTASSPVATANYDIAPDGTMTATRVVFDLNGGNTYNDRSILRQAIPVGSNYYFSIYVKSTNGTEQKVFWHDGGEVTPVTVTNEWKRITYDARSNVSYGGIALNGLDGVDTSDILVWGFQIETGNVASSYIPTSGSTVQRAAETASGSGSSGVFNDSEGILYANIAANADDSTYRSISINNGSTSNYVQIGFDSSGSNKIFGNIRPSGSSFSVTTSNIVNFNKVLIKYKVNDCSLWINGFEVGIDLNGVVPSGLNELGFDTGGVATWYGKAKEIAYYDEILTDEELEYMTSYRSLSEMLKELNIKAL